MRNFRLDCVYSSLHIKYRRNWRESQIFGEQEEREGNEEEWMKF